MVWYANQLYTLPRPQIIEAFQQFPYIAKRMFHLNHLDGIQSEYTKERMKRTPDDVRKHALPEQGLLVVAPSTRKNGYGNSYLLREQSSNQENKISEDFENWGWAEVSNAFQTTPNLPSELTDFSKEEKALFGFLQQLNAQTHIPLFYYECAMWGGSIDMEIAIVFDKNISIYDYSDDEDNDGEDPEENKTIERLSGKKFDESPLQLGFQHLGFNLPTPFFAPHECSFDWSFYLMGKTA